MTTEGSPWGSGNRTSVDRRDYQSINTAKAPQRTLEEDRRAAELASKAPQKLGGGFADSSLAPIKWEELIMFAVPSKDFYEMFKKCEAAQRRNTTQSRQEVFRCVPRLEAQWEHDKKGILANCEPEVAAFSRCLASSPTNVRVTHCFSFVSPLLNCMKAYQLPLAEAAEQIRPPPSEERGNKMSLRHQ